MSDSRQVHRAIKKAIKQLYPHEPEGNEARHLETLVSMVTGIVLSKSCQLPAMASKIPGEIHPDSQVKKMSRWTQNEAVTSQVYFVPFVAALLAALARLRPLMFIMDGSAVAHGCVTLLVSVVYAQRAIPVAWLVVEGKKGHFPTEKHVDLVREVQALVPAEAEVIFLGDGEFDSPTLLEALTTAGWEYACRTAKNITYQAKNNRWSRLDALPIQRGERVFRKGVKFTADAFGPVTVIVWWGAGYDEPLYLVTNARSVLKACQWYRKRAHIETFFSDQKSRGFHLDKSHLSDPARVARLMLAACLAYLWVIYLGTVAQQDGWQAIIHRRQRCDWSLFQLGLHLLDYLLKQALPLPTTFDLRPKSVR
jgi:hypothetical protein